MVVKYLVLNRTVKMGILFFERMFLIFYFAMKDYKLLT